MKNRIILSTVLTALSLSTFNAYADDGERLVRNVSSSPGNTENPEPEGEHAFIKMMNFHVPSQNAAGELVPIEYKNIDEVLVKTETKAKPLINAYVYGPVVGFENPEASGFSGHGRRDAFVAVSLDDGETWKNTNLSNSADKSSFAVSTPLQDPGVAEGEGSVIEFDPAGPTLEEVSWDAKNNGGKLHVHGDTETDKREQVTIRNAVTKDDLFTVRSQKTGEFEKERRLSDDPCFIQAGVDGVFGPALEVEGSSEECVGPNTGGNTLITDYPGDVPNVFHAVAGNKVLVAWHSKFCSSGNPVWSSEFPREEVAAYLGVDNTSDLYLTDMFGAAGSQDSTNYNELDAAPVGEVPYSCLWSARGVMREDPVNEGKSQMVWFQAERLTSGARDVNRVETSCVAGAGCAITWQEDPEGVRPGEGEGPGTGWSGATTASKTDIWYSFVEWEDFDIVDNDGEPLPLADNGLEEVFDTNRPVPYVPMMSAVRLTNNDRCTFPVDPEDASFCNNSLAAPYGIINQCVGSVEVPFGNAGNLNPVCVVDSNKDGTMNAGDMPNLANNAASRPRLNLQPRDSDGDGVVDDAWVVIVSEEDKGLGRYGFINTEEWELGNLEDTAEETCIDPPQQPDEETGCQKADIGKNVFWTSFNLGSPNTSAGVGVEYSLVSNVLSQGAQLNQPEVNWRTGTYYPPMSTEQMWDFSNDSVDLNYLIFNTEIARRTSMMSQPLSKALSGNGLVAMPLWKQGIVNQGGPADISTRRFVVNTGSGETCPIEVDADVPSVDSARYFLLPNGKGRIELQVDGLDGDLTTQVRVNNAVTDDKIVQRFYDADDAWTESTEDFLFRIAVGPGSTRPVPCSIQLADVDGSLEFGPWIAVENAPADCSGPIPPACDEEVTTMAAVDERTENPYSANNMVCAWYDGEGGEHQGVKYFTDGSNPYYPYGLCMSAPINLSARTPYKCEASGEADGSCPGVSDMTCVDDAAFGQLCSSENNPEDNKTYDKLVSWYECPGWNGANISGDAVQNPATCGTEPDSAMLMSNMDDASWYNPLEVSKAHRGYLDGNHIMMIYAWSPNWKLNKVGNDRYELYTRRSFDGGLTWGTTPTSFTASNGLTYSGSGTTTCETMRDADSINSTHMCTAYAAGVPEQSRNVSQLKSMKNTILDPRYTAAGGIPPKGVTDPGNIEWGTFEAINPTDILNPSRNFVVFEDGDNTTVEFGEAEPLNLAYGRAERFGDHFTVWSEIDTGVSDPAADCYPSNAHGDPDVAWAAGTGFCNEFDTLEGFKDALSEEASITASAGGDFLYGVWGQFNVDSETGEFIDGDSMFRRVMYLDDYISPDNAYTLPGSSQTGDPDPEN
ncbi:choice-of-anchor O protein [uncultured Cocleimonas sp.]|uniref:choice-of-anchor O protein n=1 Tax=uncultured Cocleimonas sp. TaxID=1051587 RepID=UPI002622532C|nr:choice-of-anchor O protein [uncultured Cocleimonas sp.]